LDHELKGDGYRIIARRENGVVHLWSRTGRNWAVIGSAMARLPVESITPDGEAVACSKAVAPTSTPCTRATPAAMRA
jgi:ATP-dependent DNA ligase